MGDVHVLREGPSPEDEVWRFFNVPAHLMAPPRTRSGRPRAKLVRFTPERITLQASELSSNRVVHHDDPEKLIMASFEGLRFPDMKPSVSSEYILRLLKAGLFLNNKQYRFFGHGNSQLRGRGCYLREANTDEELDERVYAMGQELKKIMNVAKRAKRIGLLFSGAEIDYVVRERVGDIGDLTIGDENFSDGCGLISRWLSIQLSRKKQIVYRGSRYTPCVFQIRYRGYKGVLMLHPALDAAKQHIVEFRKSQKKFAATIDDTFSVVGHSTPYSFGRLNNEIVVLLTSLGITTETFKRKQDEYFAWIRDAASDSGKGFEFLSALGKHRAAEKLFLYGFGRSVAPDAEDRLSGVDVQKEIRGAQMSELAAFRKNNDERKERVRMLVHKSRRLYGVCDPFRLLKEGEVHVRITTSRNGASSIHGTDVIIVRNPCLHPGDILKLRAVYKPELAHLVDCVVFASVGKRADPSKSSGGDLDGDEYFVCWDPDLVPWNVSEPYTYPPNKEITQLKITREDLARYFAFWNNSGMARTTALHNKWARYSPQGALSKECQELNALYSQAVDGARVTIPERLRSPPDPPEGSEPFILTVLADAAREFAQDLLVEEAHVDHGPLSPDDVDELIHRLFSIDEALLSEEQIVNLAYKLARRHGLDFRKYFSHINWGALRTSEKKALSAALDMQPLEEAYMWNSLLRSDIVRAQDLSPKKLGGPLRVQRLYSSKKVGRPAFFEYLVRAMQNYTRKLVVIKLDERFAFAFFMRGDIPLNEDSPVDGEHIVVASFMKETAMEAVPTFKYFPEGFRLYCGEGNVQLFNKTRANTFIHLRKPPLNSDEDFIVSIALQQISARVQRQMGRVNRHPVVDMEIHVVSNRDRVAHQLFDLRFDHVDTEEYIRRLQHAPTTYQRNTPDTAELDDLPEDLRDVFRLPEEAAKRRLASLDPDAGLADFDKIMEFAWTHHCETQLFWAFNILIDHLPLDRVIVGKWIERHAPLVFCLLKRYPPDEAGMLGDEINREELGPALVQQVIRAASAAPTLAIAALVALEKLTGTIDELEFSLYMELVELVILAIRAPEQVVETLFVLHERRVNARAASPAAEYAHKQALAVALDRAQEANDECPCDEQGRPRRQRSPPAVVPLKPFKDNELMTVIAEPRVDAPSTIRLHSHVRLRASSKPDPERGDYEVPMMDGIVTVMQAGEVRISLVHTPPPEYASMEWYLYDAGSVATFRAMMEAIRRLATAGADCCIFYRTIAETTALAAEVDGNVDVEPEMDQQEEAEDDGLNASQRRARDLTLVRPLSLVWGPPGTGKTTVVVKILESFVRSLSEGRRILMTASTNNAVDNVLERFVRLNDEAHIISSDRVIRFATDRSRVSKALQRYTLEGRVGGEIVRDKARRERAEELLEHAAIVFTTCAGAGLGGLRGITDFDTVLIDEASQVTEPVALIPLVKGCRRAVLVGDHVQLRPMVRQIGPAMLFDVSLFERLYTGPELPGMARTMLDVQYRFPRELAHFPSTEFYQGRLQTAMTDTEANRLSEVLDMLEFPWSKNDGRIQSAVFVHCGAEEDYGGSSKSNEGQAALVAHIVKLLSSWREDAPEERPELPSVAVLTPYKKQVTALRHRLQGTPVSTIDAFQGREADVIVFTSVRSNPDNDIGFVEDMRRLNVAWTRARRALIVVGDRRTMTEGSELWKRAITSCKSVEIIAPEN